MGLISLVAFFALPISAVWAEKDSKHADRVLIDPLDEDFEVHTFQVGTYFLTAAETVLRTDINRVSDRCSARLTSGVYVTNRLVMGSSTRFNGYVARVEQPLAGKDAVMEVRIDEIILENGDRLPVKAHLDTNQDDHAWGGGLTEGSIPMEIQHRVVGIGYYNKVVFGGPRRFGRHFQVKPGEYWRIVLEEPLKMLVPIHP
jgi:hypothetical protein